MKKFDLLVLGAGPAGGRVASKCAQAGWDVALVESRKFGGTCALRGCNPKKVFVHAAEVVAAAKRSDGKLCDAGDIAINWKDLQAFKQTFVQDIPENSREKFDKKGITTYLASPRFISPTQIQIGDEAVEAKHIVIATGAKPRELDFEGAEHLVKSDQFMNLEDLPERIVFVGGGYISFEFAHVAARAGAKVTVVERGKRPLKTFDAGAVVQLVKKSRGLGIDVRTETSVSSVKKNGDGSMSVAIESDGEVGSIEADMVVHGAGRTPNFDGLDLEAGNVEFDQESGIIVDECLRSKSNSIVLAAGDCAGSDVAALTPTANAEGYAVVQTLLSDDKTEPFYGPVPAVAFTIPAISSVGLTEEQAKEKGIDFKVNEEDISEWGSVRKVCESVAWYKTLIDESTGKIIGAHLIGPGAAETINLFAVAMRAGLTVDDIQELSLAFPTNGYNIRQMV